MISGLMKPRGCGWLSPSSLFFARSMVISRIGCATWIAASPIPGASYMVSNMSSASLRISGVTFSIGLETSRNCLSGRMMISRSAMFSSPGRRFKALNTLGQCEGERINRPVTINVPSSFASLRESDRDSRMNPILFTIGDWPVHITDVAIGFAAAALLLLLTIVIAVARSGRRGAEHAMTQAARADELEQRLHDMLRAQAEANGRVDAMASALAGRQADMARAVNERLDSVTHRVGQSMETSTRNTMDSLRVLHERLGIIDNAHKNLTDLTTQVTTLRDVLANKQARGAFGQARMEAIVQDGMPKGSYEFQFTLSTGKRPDCVVFLPDQRPLCIDAKFPLEAM